MHDVRESIWQEFGADVITEELSEYIAIALLLVAERAKGAESFWKAYLDVLPTVEDVRRFFTVQLTKLQGKKNATCT